jgi:putative spermidine/putrescine transport system ATP-binding protein
VCGEVLTSCGDARAQNSAQLDRSVSTRAVALEIVGLEKSYGQFKAVHDVTLSVRQGEFVAIVGPSGSGKTSVLMMIAGFIDPSRGDMKIAGRSMLGVAPEQRDVGVVFQNYALFPHLSAAQNIAFPLEMRKMRRTEINRRVEEALKLVGLAGFGDRYPHQLSGGQQQRVALTRALVFRPAILLMDEPLGALDKQLRQQMQLELRSLHRDLGTTVLYITHDQQEALALADRIAVMRDGCLVQVDQPEKLFREPRDQFVAAFIGDCNLLAADGIVRVQDGWHVNVRGYSGTIPLDHGVASIDGGTRIAVRPHVATIRVSESADGLNGRLMDVVFMGESIEYVVDIGEGKNFIARESSSSKSISIPIGSPVKISWPWTEVRIL